MSRASDDGQRLRCGCLEYVGRVRPSCEREGVTRYVIAWTPGIYGESVLPAGTEEFRPDELIWE